MLAIAKAENSTLAVLSVLCTEYVDSNTTFLTVRVKHQK